MAEPMSAEEVNSLRRGRPYSRASDADAAVTRLIRQVDWQKAALARVKALHKREGVYDYCPDDGCEEADCFVAADAGVFLHGSAPKHYLCSHCFDFYGEQMDYPCATIRALEGENDD